MADILKELFFKFMSMSAFCQNFIEYIENGIKWQKLSRSHSPPLATDEPSTSGETSLALCSHKQPWVGKALPFAFMYIFLKEFFSFFAWILTKFVANDPVDKSALVRLYLDIKQMPSYWLSERWRSSLKHTCVTRPHLVHLMSFNWFLMEWTLYSHLGYTGI